MDKQDFLTAAILNNRELLEEWLVGDGNANVTFLNEVLLKAAEYGSFSVVELLSALGKTAALIHGVDFYEVILNGKKMALQYILYSDLYPWFKSQGRILVGQRSSIDFYIVYHDRYFYRQLCECNFKNLLEIAQESRTILKQKSKVKTNFSLTMHLDRGQRLECNVH